MRLPDPDRSRIILMGTSRYRSGALPDIPQVVFNLRDLSDLLAGPDGIVPFRNCDVLLNKNLAELGERLPDRINEAKDLLLVYYSGHGLVHGRRKDLYLTLRDTNPRAPDYNALKVDTIRSDIFSSRAANKVVILDSCFSGRYIHPSLAPAADEVLGQIQVTGTYVITSSQGGEVSLALPGERGTAFTERLVRILRDGIPQGPDLIGLADIYDALTSMMRRESLPLPESLSNLRTGQLALAHNRQAPSHVAEPLRREFDLAATPAEAGDHDAVARLRDLVARQVRLLGQDHPDTRRTQALLDHLRETDRDPAWRTDDQARTGLSRPAWSSRPAQVGIVLAAVCAAVAAALLIGGIGWENRDTAPLRQRTTEPREVATLATGSNLTAVAALPDGVHVLLADAGTNSLSEIDVRNGSSDRSVTTSPYPVAITVAPDGESAYVGTRTGVDVVDLTSFAAIGHIDIGGIGHRMAVSPDGERLYVATYGNGTIAFVDTASRVVVARVGVQRTAEDVAVSPDGATLYVAVSDYTETELGNITVVNTATHEVSKTIIESGYLNQARIEVVPNGTFAYTSGGSRGNGGLHRLDLEAGDFQAPLNTGYNESLVVTGDGRYVTVTQRASRSLLVIDTVAGGSKTVPLRHVPTAVTASPDGQYAYVIDGVRDYEFDTDQPPAGSSLLLVDYGTGQ